jgi:heme/copper-type cytochrome/quinol oxidase subunit 1
VFYKDQLLCIQSNLCSLYITSDTSCISRYQLVVIFIGIVLTFIPMHFLGFLVIPRRIYDFEDNLNSWNYM